MKNVFADFLLTAGLYDSVEITKENIIQLRDLLDGKVKLYTYCKNCGQNSVFVMRPITIGGSSSNGGNKVNLLGTYPLSEKNRKSASNENQIKHNNAESTDWCFIGDHSEIHIPFLVFQFYCAQDHSHRLDFVVRTYGYTMKKIGQYPSVADLTFPELDEFKKVIDETSRKELGTAIGLYANGVGAGSYVYLRRIFERILDNAKTEAEQAGAVDMSGYDRMKEVDRIRLLKDYLPAMINDNHVFYGIVSKGIHELSEDECISYFPVLKDAIFMILRQWAQKKQEQEDAKRLRASLSQIASQVKS